MKPIFAQCLSHGFNVVSLAEETFWPWRIRPEDSKELDELAKANGVTLTSVGIQDVVWLNCFCTLSAVCHKMDKVIGRAVADQNPYGVEATKGIGFGLTVEEFNERTAKGAVDPNWFGMTLEAIIARLHMTPTKITDILEPVTTDHTVHYNGGNMDIPAGRVMGWNRIPDVLNAAPGLVSLDQMPSPMYRALPPESYIEA